MEQIQEQLLQPQQGLKEQLLQPRNLLLSTCLCLLATVGLLLHPGVLQERVSQAMHCQQIVQPQEELSRQRLAQLLSVPERSQRRQTQKILQAPYCRLPDLNIRAGATTERDVYRLAFDSQNDLIVLYEGQSYVGYGFKHLR